MTEIEALALSTELPLLMGLSVGYRSPEGKAATKRTTTPGSMKSLAFSGQSSEQDQGGKTRSQDHKTAIMIATNF